MFRPSVNGFLQDVENRHVSGVAPFLMVRQKNSWVDSGSGSVPSE